MSANIKEQVLHEIKDVEQALKTAEGLEKYLEDCLSVEYETYYNSEKRRHEYLGAKLLMAFGGPNVEVNTRYNTVFGNWWGDRMEMSYKDDENILWSYFEEVFEALR